MVGKLWRLFVWKLDGNHRRLGFVITNGPSLPFPMWVFAYTEHQEIAWSETFFFMCYKCELRFQWVVLFFFPSPCLCCFWRRGETQMIFGDHLMFKKLSHSNSSLPQSLNCPGQKFSFSFLPTPPYLSFLTVLSCPINTPESICLYDFNYFSYAILSYSCFICNSKQW